MRARVALLLVTAMLIGTAIGVHVDGFDLGWWLMVVAGFLGSWAFVPLGAPASRRDSEKA
jgi:hypothetical protein